jgi:hypothetical protein
MSIRQESAFSSTSIRTSKKRKQMTSMTQHRIALVRGLTARIKGPDAPIRPSQSGDRVHRDHAERGDVPGWVMITLMSAVLVAALLALAGPALEAMFNQAMDTVGQ